MFDLLHLHKGVKLFFAVSLVLGAFGLLLSSCDRQQASPVSAVTTADNPPALALTGNGAPNGAHYNLNIIGVPKGKTADMTGGNRIFVPLDGNCKIMLTAGDFQVLDGNGTDGTAAFQLPSPDSGNTGTTSYSVYARALGKPGGSSIMTTCGTDSLGTTYCSTSQMVSVRSKGKSSFANVSKDLLYVYADINGDGIIERVPLFDSSLQGYYWDYDNNGLKIIQLRFYDVSTVVP